VNPPQINNGYPYAPLPIKAFSFDPNKPQELLLKATYPLASTG
jgi:hypothetical protein